MKDKSSLDTSLQNFSKFGKVAYELELPTKLAVVHPIFYVYTFKNDICDISLLVNPIFQVLLAGNDRSLIGPFIWIVELILGSEAFVGSYW